MKKNCVVFAILLLLTDFLPKICTADPYSCKTPVLLEAVENKINEYADSLQVYSTVQQRRKELKFRKIGSFSAADARNFSQDEDFQTANALISIKINLKKKPEEILICRQDSSGKRTPFYFIGYPDQNRYIVHILNLSDFDEDYTAHTLELKTNEAGDD